MAIEIVGDPKDVKRYRRFLIEQGYQTKKLKSNNPLYADKPDNYRLMTGSIQKFVSGESLKSETKYYNPDERLIIAGVANANIVDRTDEILNPAGVDVRNFQKSAILLADHMYFTREAIGQVTEIKPEDDGVKFEAWIGDPKAAPLTDLQKDIRRLVAQGILKTVSVGFIPKKIKAPVYDDEMRIVEPPVIENWELLELSVVAVPCNPDATFEMKTLTHYLKAFNEKQKSEPINQLSLTSAKESDQNEVKEKQEDSDSTTIQTLIFDKEMFTVEQAKQWADEHDFKSDSVDETEDSIRLRQIDPDEFYEDSFRTIEIDDGIKAVIGKLKEGEGMDEKTAQGLLDGIKNQGMLLEGLKTTMERSVELSETMLSYLEAKGEDKPKEDEKEEGMEEEKPMSEEEEKEEKEDEKTARLTIVESKIAQISEILDVIASKLG
jgi:HK97 family phage prohead protease